MKKLILLSYILLASLLMQAKGFPESSVPQNVKSYVTNNYAQARNIEWDYDKKKDLYEAVFYINGMKIDLGISSSGSLNYSNENLQIKNIPANVASYIKSNHPDAEIQAGYKVVKEGATSYSIDLAIVDNKGKVSTKNLLFDDKGNVIKK